MSSPNHLSSEKSPYLLQHAENPVDWFPWGKEALEKSKNENKPILLSIGYSTCHWCHVMAHESFEDETIAKKINSYFVPIKVDREERPDIDQVYMASVLAMTGQGGWPLTVFLTPDQKPFFGGTYFPPYAKWGSPGFGDVLESIHQAWSTRREDIIESSQNLTNILKERKEQTSQGPLREDILDQAFLQFEGMFDKTYGGFGHQPKFPSSHNLSFLLRYWFRTHNQNALNMVIKTLDHMACGGIFDHLGGGFHRYSTDETWQIPHFEKMLYDQAMLISTYTEGFQITQKKEYENIVRKSCDYVLRDMQYREGGFFSAEDADSLDPYENDSKHAKEGAFYLWQKTHIEEILGDAAPIFIYFYDIKKEGNARLDPHQEFSHRNVLSQEHSLEDTAKFFKKDIQEVAQILEDGQKKLLSERSKRKRPHLDDKILTDWNGMTISALCQAGSVLNEKRYIDAAKKAANFILEKLVRDGRLLHRFRDHEADILGTLDDYVFFMNGLLDLYEATFDIKYLKEANQFKDDMFRLFEDESQGGFFFTAHDSEALIVRQKEIYDGAIPSGNSIVLWVLMRFFHMSFDELYIEKIKKSLRAFSRDVSTHPSGYAQFLSGFDYFLGPSTEIVIAQKKSDPHLKDFLNVIYRSYFAHKILLLNEIDKEKSSLDEIKFLSMMKEHIPIENQLTVYICTNNSCQRPVTQQSELMKTLSNLTKK
jgi:uncharacterized protein YyaL (SSP411 family)